MGCRAHERRSAIERSACADGSFDNAIEDPGDLLDVVTVSRRVPQDVGLGKSDRWAAGQRMQSW
ncbi:hypothetical protein NY08_2086 [Rhodococcus sp. B7740]|nr:hypothetical protein NY08_2086 [Rhodococcus sp. B7740]